MSSKLFFILLFVYSISANAQERRSFMINQLTTKFESFKFNPDGKVFAESSGKLAWSRAPQETETEKVFFLEQSQNPVNGVTPRVQLRLTKANELTEVSGVGPMDDDKDGIGFFHVVTNNPHRSPTAVTKCEDIGDCFSVTDAFCGKIMRTFGADSPEKAKAYVIGCYNMPLAFEGRDDYGLQAEANLAQSRLKEMGKDVSVLKAMAPGKRDKTRADHGVPTKNNEKHVKDYQNYEKILKLCHDVDYKSWLERNPVTTAGKPAEAAGAKK